MLSFVILIVYIVSYVLLMPFLDNLIGGGPVWLVNLAESLVPALIATGAVMLTWPLFRDKRVLPAAYVWLALIALAILAGVVFRLRDDPAAGGCLYETGKRRAVENGRIRQDTA